MARWHFDSFSKSFLDPSRWRQVFGPNGGSNVASGGVLTMATTPSYAMHLYPNMPSAHDMTLTCRLRRSNNTASQQHRLAIRSDQTLVDPTSNNYRSINNAFQLIISETGATTMYKVVNGSATTLGTGLTLFPSAGVWYRVKFETASGVVRARVWQDGTTEPSTWNYSATDDSTLPNGKAEIVTYRTVPEASALELADWEVRSIGLPITPTPFIYDKPDGTRVNFGRTRRSRVDDCLDPTPPSYVTASAALSHSTSTLRRTLTAAGNTVETVTLPAVTAGSVETIWFWVNNLSVSASASVSWALQLVGASTTYEFRNWSTGVTAALAAGSTVQQVNYNFMLSGEAPRHRNWGLLLLPRKKQLIALTADTMYLGWIDLSTAVTEALTPTLRLTATTASARTASWDRVALDIDTL